MRILLRDCARALFYAGEDQWTADHASAIAFKDTNHVIDFVCEAGLSNVEVVMHFDNPEFEIPLSIAGTGRVDETDPDHPPATDGLRAASLPPSVAG
jgi:hypothetical protein